MLIGCFWRSEKVDFASSFSAKSCEFETNILERAISHDDLSWGGGRLMMKYSRDCCFWVGQSQRALSAIFGNLMKPEIDQWSEREIRWDLRVDFLFLFRRRVLFLVAQTEKRERWMKRFGLLPLGFRMLNHDVVARLENTKCVLIKFHIDFGAKKSVEQQVLCY